MIASVSFVLLFQYRCYIAANDRSVDEVERPWKETVMGHSRYYPGIWLKGNEESREYPVRESGMPPKNRIEHVPNTCLERYLQSSMFSNLNLKCSCLKSWKVPTTRMDSPVFGQHTRLVRYKLCIFTAVSTV